MPGGLETTPRDDLTKLPLSVLTNRTDFLLSGADYHHHFHPMRSPELGYDNQAKKLPTTDPLYLPGRAVRFSRGQFLPRWMHDRYHEIFFGPELPQTNEEKFTAVILSCAGVVPRQAINLYAAGDYQKVNLTNRQHDFIRRRIYFEGAASSANRSRKNKIGQFIAEYAINNSLNEIIDEKAIRLKAEDFLKPTTEEKRIEAGRYLLSQAVGASLVGLIDVHQEAQKEGMISNTKRKLGEVVLKYFPEHRFPDYFAPLENQLALIDPSYT